MQITEIIKIVATTLNALITVGCFAGSIYYSKDNKNRGTMIALLAISGVFIFNSVLMWV